MNRIIEIAAMAIGGLSLFLVCFVGFVGMSGKDMSQVAVIGRLFPTPPASEEGAHDVASADEHPAAENEHGAKLSDAAVVEASLGVLSAWTLPSPYSTSELRVLSEELKKKRSELEEAEHALARRQRAVQEDEAEVEERMKVLEELRSHLESLQAELSEREQRVTRGESAAAAKEQAGWTELAAVIESIEETPAAARKLQEFEPAQAAKILRSMEDQSRAGEILNAVDGSRWKEYAAAYTAERPSTPRKK